MVCEEGVETLEAPLVIVLKKREGEGERERKGLWMHKFLCTNRAQSSSVFLFCKWRFEIELYCEKNRCSYTLQDQRLPSGQGCGYENIRLGEKVRVCDRPKMLQNKFLKNGNLLSYRCLCKRQLCEKVQRSILPKLLDMRCLVPLAQLTYPDFFSAVQEIKRVLAHHLLALSLTWKRGLTRGDKANSRYNSEGGELHETLNLNNCIRSSMAVITDQGFSTTISGLNS